MNKQEQHEMVLETTHPSGAEGWYCPLCGRRMLIKWEPQFQRIILEAGDDHAIHSASKGTLQTESSQPEAADAADAPPPIQGGRPSGDDPSLAPWLTWLDDTDFEDLWDDKGQ